MRTRKRLGIETSGFRKTDLPPPFPVSSSVDSNLCFIPDVDIDDGSDEEKRLAYVRSILLERQREDGAKCIWTFTFNFSGTTHAHGILYVVHADVDETRVWEVMNSDDWGKWKERSRRSDPKVEPKPGQFVSYVKKSFQELEPEDLLSSLGELMANRILGA